MSRSQTAERAYTNARERAEKASAGFEATYLAIPDGVSLYKPKAGVALIDILPYVAGPHNPWADEGAIHWERTFFTHGRIGAGGDSYICPLKSARQRCPICEYRAKLSNDDPDDIAESKSLKPKQRQIFNIKDAKAPDKGIQIWEYSYHLFGKLLEERIKTADEQDGWDLFFTAEDGSTLRVSFTEETGDGFTWIDASSIDFKRRNAWDLDKVLARTHDLDAIVNSKMLEYDELAKIFAQTAKAAPKAAPKGKTAAAAAADDFDAPSTAPAKGRKPVPEAADDFDQQEDVEAAAAEEEEPAAPAPRARRPAPAAAPADDGFEDAPAAAPARRAAAPAAAPARRAAAPAPVAEEEDFEAPAEEEERPKVRTQTQEEVDEVAPARPKPRAAAPAPARPAARPAATKPAAKAAASEWDDFSAAEPEEAPAPKAKPARR